VQGYFPQLALHPSAFRPPLYPVVLGGAYRVFGSSVVVGRVLNLAIGVGVVVLVFCVARRIATPRAGVAAALIAAVYPPLLANDVALLTEPLALLLLLGMVLALGRRNVVWGGVLCGLLVLTRASAQGVALVVGVWVLW